MRTRWFGVILSHAKAMALMATLLSVLSAGASAQYIQRTMRKMAESTEKCPATVRMLFYGQSIVEQGWHENFVRMMKKRYPTVNFEVRNLAIGGFTSEILIRTAESDLYPEYADIVFFHDYGSTALVRTMIERLRARTTSEIVMWTSHVNREDAAKHSLEELKREEDARSRDLAKIAADNHCMFVNLRRKWCETLIERGWSADRLLQNDGVHLNAKSEAFDLYARCIAEDMVRLDGVGPDERSGTITEIEPGSLSSGDFVANADGSVDFPFVGNRVELSFVPYSGFVGSPFRVLLDGKPLSEHAELFRHKRASNLISWMPLLLHQGARTLPVAETWRLTFVEGTSPDGKPIRYRVDGSRTGFDGEGRSDRDFVSKSGRVTIKASDFHVWQYGHFAKGNPTCAAKPGQWITWETVADFQEEFGQYKPAGKTFVVLSGCTNGPHRLTFVPSVPSRRPCLGKLIVHRPFGKEPGETADEIKAAAFPEFSAPRAVTSGPHEHLLANYFGINAWSPDGTKLLVLETDLVNRMPDGQPATLGIVDMADGNRFIPVTTTRCWNFQEAAMAHWLPNEKDTIVFNDIRNGKFSAVVMNWRTREERSYPYPVSAVSEDGTWALSINYARLYLTRPDYGYAGEGQDARRNVTFPEDDGVFRLDLRTGEAKLLVSCAAVRDQVPAVDGEGGLSYVCHTTISKDMRRIYFLSRSVNKVANAKTFEGVKWETTAFTANADGSGIRKAAGVNFSGEHSHFNWKPALSERDARTMVVTSYWQGKRYTHIEFTVGEEDAARQLGGVAMDFDGHAIYSPDGRFVSGDGYWDADFYRHWKLVRLSDGAVKDFGSYYIPERYREVYTRCDLHPRWRGDGRQIAFNSVHEGSRQVYVRDLVPDPEDSPSAGACVGADLYVSPNGDDANPGTPDAPLRTPEAARDALRRLRAAGKAPAHPVISFLDGVYRLDRPLSLAQEDSGTVWRAENRGKAVLNGGRRLSWRKPGPAEAGRLALLPPAAREKVRVADFPAGCAIPGFLRGNQLSTPSNDIPFAVFSPKGRLTCARWPNDCDALTEKVFDVRTFGVAPEKATAWSREPDGWVFGLWCHDWIELHTPLEVFDAAAGKVGFAPDYVCHLSCKLGYARPYRAYNLFCELDRPGEWVVDRESRLLWLWPGEGEAELVTGGGLVEGRGLRDVTFDGFVFERCRQTAVRLDDSERTRVVASTFRDTCSWGVEVKGGSGCRVEGCDMYELGEGGVRLDGGDLATLTPGNHAVVNCHFHHLGRTVFNYRTAVDLRGVGNRAEHNLIHHLRHAAIMFYGNDHYIGWNVMHDVVNNYDAGAIYTWQNSWVWRGGTIEHNLIHVSGKVPHPTETMGIYLDDQASDVDVRYNIVDYASYGGMNGGGQVNRWYGNVFLNASCALNVDARPGFDRLAKEVEADNAKMCGSDLWRRHYPHLHDYLRTEPAMAATKGMGLVVTNNVFAGCGPMRKLSGDYEWGMIAKSVTLRDNVELPGDPGFRDYANFDWRAAGDSPVRAIVDGCQFGKMGLYESDLRASPAVKFGPGMTPAFRIGRPSHAPQIEIEAIFLPFDKERKCAKDCFLCWVLDYGTPLVESRGDVDLSPERPWRRYGYAFTPVCDSTLEFRFSGSEGIPTEYRSVRIAGAENEQPVGAAAFSGRKGAPKKFRTNVRKDVPVTVTYEARMGE